MSYLIDLECPQCHQVFSAEKEQTFCHECHTPILARYDLAKLRRDLNRDELQLRPHGMWRWRELLPIHNLNYIASLGEGDTPLLPLPRLGKMLGIPKLWAKDESVNPTASFKARGLSAAVSKAKEIGLNKLAIPTAGNAGGALAAYASRARMKSTAVMPGDTPKAIINECQLYGAKVVLIDGLISDCAQVVAEMTSSGEWFSVSTFREPYRLEGKKIMGFELAETFKWRLPDVIIYPTGGGTGLVGMWKAFLELQSLGWLESSHLPKMVSVQSEGCAPVVKAFQSGSEYCEFWENAETIAGGIRVPLSLADRLILKIIRESGGSAVAVKDEAMIAAQSQLAKQEGIFASPEGAATLAAVNQLLVDGTIQPTESVVLFITASGVKYI
ncbi:MAG: threonine synthase [Anaerolineales bacterium]